MMFRTLVFCSAALLLIAAAPLQGPTEEPVSLAIPGGHLSGTLTIPAGITGPVPVALIIAGSGPTDRDANSSFVRTDAYKKLALGLAAQGIATLRYDKRGIGASTITQAENDVRFDDFVADATKFADMLAADKRFSSVTLIGHSEGSLIGMVAASRDPHIRGLVSLEGAGRDLATIVDAQVKANPANPPYIVKEVEQYNASLLAGKTIPNPDPVLAALFRPSVQPFVISEYRYDPQKEIAKLAIPVLIISGTHDIQILPIDAQNLAVADPRAKSVAIEGMNHVLVDAPADRDGNLATYSQPALPLDPKLVPQIASFIKGATP